MLLTFRLKMKAALFYEMLATPAIFTWVQHQHQTTVKALNQ
jgi:hypothetical protein